MRGVVFKVLTGAVIVAQIVLCVVIVLQREEIPIHWNAVGAIDSVGSPWIAWILPGVSAIVWGMCAFFKKHPEYCNIPTHVKDRSKAYDLLRSYLDWVAFLSIVVIAYLTVCIYMSQLHFLVMSIIGVVFLYVTIRFAAKLGTL